MDINGASRSNRMDQATSTRNPLTTAPPSSIDSSAFDRAMNIAEEINGIGDDQSSASTKLTDVIPVDAWQQLIQLMQQLLQIVPWGNMGGGGNTRGGSTTGPNGSVIPIRGSGVGGSAGQNELIPRPTEYIKLLSLGDKPVTVGGDGTSSAEEVAATANQIQYLYDNSPTFKSMIDNSSDPAFEVSVGRRPDNTSWGNTDGRVFMNINNVNPGNSDNFQSLMGHEFAHASIDVLHGSRMEQLQSAVAQEA
ncbi:hypothetical protein [Thiofilum flexile]|uniref:hypothetical protein n=1 Tax=Thiofilum flexile TaxID=125627 RepID=UPI000375A774|nr:hypothetical protein [Thiofilum flexile]